MEKQPVRKHLYTTPLWVVFSYLLEHPEKTIMGASLVKSIPTLSKTAIYDAILELSECGVLVAVEETTTFELNRSCAWIRSMMVTDSLMMMQPLTDSLSQISSKVILFGSRASDNYITDSDYDLLIVSASTDVRKVISKSNLEEKIQLILKTPEEWLDLHKTNPELYKSIQKGIVLWERK